MKNLHLEHLEDLIVSTGDPLGPVILLRNVVDWMQCRPIGIRNYIIPNTSISTKWDGAPAFVCGPHPETGQFFVGTKSVFSGKLNFTHEDIDRNHTNKELADKLHLLLDYLPELNICEVVQGDMLWWPGSIWADTTDPNSYLWTENFKPNTLTYKMRWTSALTKTIGSYKIGVVIHTKYSGSNTLSDMTASFNNLDGCVRSASPNVLVFNTRTLGTSEPLMKQADESLLRVNLETAKEYTWRVKKDVLDYIASNKKFRELLNRYINHSIRSNSVPNDFALYMWINEQFEKHAKSLKTYVGYQNVIYEKNTMLDEIDGLDFEGFFKYYDYLRQVKTQVIRELDKAFATDIDIYLPNGNRCGHEGYVVTTQGYTFKLVDRYTFSQANFNFKADWKNA